MRSYSHWPSSMAVCCVIPIPARGFQGERISPEQAACLARQAGSGKTPVAPGNQREGQVTFLNSIGRRDQSENRIMKKWRLTKRAPLWLICYRLRAPLSRPGVQSICIADHPRGAYRGRPRLPADSECRLMIMILEPRLSTLRASH